MTIADFRMARGDLLPAYAASLKNPDGSAADLTGATVLFWFRPQDRSQAWKNAAAVIVGAATAGNVRYDWVAGDTAVAGIYDTKWVATYPGPKEMTFPNDRYQTLVIHEDV